VRLGLEPTPELERAETAALVLRDGARARNLASLASPFVERQASFSPAPPWPSGATVEVVDFSPATDTVLAFEVNYITANGGVLSTGASRDGPPQSFTVPDGVDDVERVELLIAWCPEMTCDAPLTCTCQPVDEVNNNTVFVRGVSTVVVDAPIAR